MMKKAKPNKAATTDVHLWLCDWYLDTEDGSLLGFLVLCGRSSES